MSLGIHTLVQHAHDSDSNTGPHVKDRMVRVLKTENIQSGDYQSSAPSWAGRRVVRNSREARADKHPLSIRRTDGRNKRISLSDRGRPSPIVHNAPFFSFVFVSAIIC